MRSLNKKILFSTVILIQIFMHISWGSTLSLTYEKGSQTSINELNIPFQSQSFSLSDIKLREDLVLNTSFSIFNQSLINRNLTLENGEEAPLSQFDNGKRNIFEISANYSVGPHSVTLSTLNDLKASVFKESLVKFANRTSFYSGATGLNFAVSLSNQNQPTSYFTNPTTLRGEQRAQQIKSAVYLVGLDQIWTERYKTDFSIFTKNSEGYRPNQLGLLFKQAFALGERWSYKNELGYVQEDTSAPLSEDRGYFKSIWLDQEVNYEWRLDSFIGFGWSTLDENEKDPRRNFSQSLGSDQFSMFFKHQLRNWSYDLRAQSTLTSNNESSLNMKGNIAWIY